MSLNDLAQRINATAKAKGFWEEKRNFAEMLMLATSELAEALEEHRNGKPVHYYAEPILPYSLVAEVGVDQARVLMEERRNSAPWKPEGVAVELADCIIRCLDTMHSLGVDIDAIVEEKMRYNESRPYKHGKAY